MKGAVTLTEKLMPESNGELGEEADVEQRIQA
jgi:hypothetical protein